MGYLVHMNCRDCGYETNNMRFGVTFFDRRVMGPAFNAESGEIVEVDYANIPAAVITPYSSRNLQKPGQQKTSTNIYNCCDHQLQGEGNFCPSCHSYSMSVVLGGLVD